MACVGQEEIDWKVKTNITKKNALALSDFSVVEPRILLLKQIYLIMCGDCLKQCE